MSPKDIIGDVTTIIPQDAVAAAAPVGVDLPTAAGLLSTIISTTTTALVASATQTSMTSVTDSGDSGGGADNGECRLLGPFALLVQLALGGLALLSLVYKRWRERPQRPLKIWFFDVSKQVVGSVLVHIANIFMSELTSGRFSIKVEPGTVQTASRLLRRDDDAYVPNPCSFYLLNLAIDTTLGIPVLIILLRICTGLISYTPMGKPAESIQSGHYGSPPKAVWWLKQSFIYFCGLFGMKICVLLLFLILPWIARVGDWALSWTEGNERLQIVFVMMLFPLIMNALQYYIIDSFIKKKETDHERLATQDRDDDDDPFNDALLDEDVLSEAEEETPPAKLKTYKGMARRGSKSGAEEYDPNQDGRDDPHRSSSQGQQKMGKVLPKELAPPE